MTCFKQIYELQHGLKTETRRVVKPGDTELVKPLANDTVFFHDDRMFLYHRANETREITEVQRNDRRIWRVSQDYAICPKRGHAQIGRYRLLEIHQEPLHDLTHEGAIAEGIWFNVATGLYHTSILAEGYSTATGAYYALWQIINKTSPTRWLDNPLVWVQRFEMVTMNKTKAADWIPAALGGKAAA